jgi:hypothetical protein
MKDKMVWAVNQVVVVDTLVKVVMAVAMTALIMAVMDRIGK